MTKQEAIWYLQPIADSAGITRYKEALQMAIDALKREVSDWMPLPETPKEEE